MRSAFIAVVTLIAASPHVAQSEQTQGKYRYPPCTQGFYEVNGICWAKGAPPPLFTPESNAVATPKSQPPLSQCFNALPSEQCMSMDKACTSNRDRQLGGTCTAVQPERIPSWAPVSSEYELAHICLQLGSTIGGLDEKKVMAVLVRYHKSGIPFSLLAIDRDFIIEETAKKIASEYGYALTIADSCQRHYGA